VQLSIFANIGRSESVAPVLSLSLCDLLLLFFVGTDDNTVGEVEETEEALNFPLVSLVSSL
jgi:hypothetical protein